jgi:hypothetical protein
LGDGGIPEDHKKNETPSWRRIIANLVETYADAQRTKDKKESAENRAVNWTAGATVAIAILTAVTIAVGISQYLIFDRQLTVMQGQLDAMERDELPYVWITVKNDNEYQVKDFVISCSFDGNSGTFLGDRLHTVYEIVKAKSSRAFVKINIGFIPSQSARSSCLLVSAVRSR